MTDRKTLEQAAMAMRDALTAMAEAFSATANAATQLIAIAEAAEREAEDTRLNAICDERKADGGIPVSLGELQWPAEPLQPTPQPRNDPAGYARPSDTINAPHGAENGADNG